MFSNRSYKKLFFQICTKKKYFQCGINETFLNKNNNYVCINEKHLNKLEIMKEQIIILHNLRNGEKFNIT